MIAKVLLLCAAVATAKATFGPGFHYPGLYGSGIFAPGLLNTVISPGITYRGASILTSPLSATHLSAIPTSYATTKTVVSAPHAVAAPIAVASPVTYAKSILAAPAHVAVAAPVTYGRSVIAAPAPIAMAAPVTTYTKSYITAPAAIASPVAIAAPVAYSKTVVAAPAAINTYSQKTVIGATSLLTGTPLIYGNGILANRLVAAAAPLGYSAGIVSPIGLKGAGLLASPVVQTILKK